MMTFLRRALPGVLAALLAFTPTARAEGTRIRIGLTPLAEFLAAYVAADQGMFARRGLDVSFVPRGARRRLTGNRRPEDRGVPARHRWWT